MPMENLFDLYVCIVEKFSAGGKLKKWQENLLRVLCILVFAAMLVLIPFGICLTGGRQRRGRARHNDAPQSGQAS